MNEQTSAGNPDELIGERVHQHMLEQGMTQTRLAALLGFTQATVSRKLSGERPWFADELIAVADALGVTVGDLFGEKCRPPAGTVMLQRAGRRRGVKAAAAMAGV